MPKIMCLDRWTERQQEPSSSSPQLGEFMQQVTFSFSVWHQHVSGNVYGNCLEATFRDISSEQRQFISRSSGTVIRAIFLWVASRVALFSKLLINTLLITCDKMMGYTLIRWQFLKSLQTKQIPCIASVLIFLSLSVSGLIHLDFLKKQFGEKRKPFYLGVSC